MSKRPPIDPSLYLSLRDEYTRRFGFELCLADANGRVIQGTMTPTRCSCAGRSDPRRRQAIDETLRWGECTINLCCDGGFAVRGAPITNNQQVLGGLIVQGVDLERDPSTAARPATTAPAPVTDVSTFS